MPAFPRTVLPQEVEWPRLPTGLRAFSESGKAQLRSIQQVGRVWSESYPPLKLTDTTNRAWLAAVEDYWRNQTILDVDHRSMRTLLGAGGGSPIVLGAGGVSITSSNNDTILVATAAAHGLVVGDEVEIASHTRSPSINGAHIVETVPLTTTFTIPSVLGAYVSGGGATGTTTKRVTGASFTSSGWTPSVTNILRAGDAIRIAGLNIVFTVTANVSSDGSGNATIFVNPPLYGGGLSSINSAVITTNATPGAVLFRAIIEDMNVPRGRGLEIYAGLTIQFREIP